MAIVCFTLQRLNDLQSILDVLVDIQLRREDVPDNTPSINDIGHARPENAEGLLDPILPLYSAIRVTQQEKG